MTRAATLDIVSNFDRLPDDGIVSPKVAEILFGDVLTPRALRRNPPIPRRQLSQRRYGFRVGDIRALVRGESSAA
jgi:hypothetical protein